MISAIYCKSDFGAPELSNTVIKKSSTIFKLSVKDFLAELIAKLSIISVLDQERQKKIVKDPGESGS